MTACQQSISKDDIGKILENNFTVERVSYGGFAPSEHSFKFRSSKDSISVTATWENFMPKDVNQFSISLEEFENVKKNIICLVDNEYAKDGEWPSNFYSNYCIKSNFKKLEIMQVPVLKCKFGKHLSEYYTSVLESGK